MPPLYTQSLIIRLSPGNRCFGTTLGTSQISTKKNLPCAKFYPATNGVIMNFKQSFAACDLFSFSSADQGLGGEKLWLG
jgi:hypothetical protein